ncbi:unnamed protein product [Fraxinus pennsylvanica]|uniref:Uncharacterized protein n=1 Tax=Fraxinus pennsylvanica TaxID=56036 RepID=A0AAD2EEH3_9LAMI|nr:unnamed protein product [Fraxinus pennsylvanica]
MTRRNAGVCRSCRSKGHFFADFSNKRRCPWCKHGFVKCFEVERETENKGKLFNCCTAKCRYWEWVDKAESSGESSNTVTANSDNSTLIEEELQQINRAFQSWCRVVEERDIEISINVTIRKGNGNVEVDRKGKGPA